MSDNNQAERQPADKHLQDKPQIFRTLRNIDLNLLTIFEAVYVHKGIVNAAKILNLTPSAISHQPVHSKITDYISRSAVYSQRPGRNAHDVCYASARIHQPGAGIYSWRPGSYGQL